ncbi:ammonia-forming cytochrome c nitrite reductase subunit c552 [Helicobacter sp. 11S02629-2]|uniref:ammonia-forming cytochrome c nitrite reductase subunit c552 n=1 Tax=Helicobacter sp. 11S02629-2 TaxID=1476195 RepID=UPI000BA69561|nr:ammonia-forming cytochrome c nitrite reductase subunit c552 [Helicobacter sp. 11S02629-2]PAF44650.1 cytochrome C [Helicobacter sp. 11S02629-2]
MEQRKSKSKKWIWWIVLIIIIILIIAIAWFNHSINSKKEEAAAKLKAQTSITSTVSLSDDDPRFTTWGKLFPSYLDMYLSVTKKPSNYTDFGGNVSYSKLIRFPQLTQIWAGYAFAVDFNEERGHYYAQIDQMETGRNRKDLLNSHGLKGFGGQPAACMHCHSGWMPWLYKNVAKSDLTTFSSTDYWTMIKNVPVMKDQSAETHISPHGGTKMGLTCSDCHNPNDMGLRITRPAAIKGYMARGYEADKDYGIKATRAEMRTMVCTQCHVEYYFKPVGHKVAVMGESIAKDGKSKWWNGTQKTVDEIDTWRDGNHATTKEVNGIELTYPWTFWPKGKPFRIEMLDKYYASVRDIFPADFTHALTKAPILKMQHPEAEMYSGSVHAANGVSCADCHMPYIRQGASKVSQHNVTSPLDDINASCKACHTQSVEYLKGQVKRIQTSIAHDQRAAEYALVSFIHDVRDVRNSLAKLPEFQTEGKADDKKINGVLKEVLELHRLSSMRVDFTASENSSGFHNPEEAARILLQSIDQSRLGQAKLAVIAAKYHIAYSPRSYTFEDIQKLNPGVLKLVDDMYGGKKGDRFHHDKAINNPPEAKLLELDKETNPYEYEKLDGNVEVK